MDTILIIFLLTVAVISLFLTIGRTRKGGGCCGSHEQSLKRKGPFDRNKHNYHYTFSIKIGGMTCNNCAIRVENALNSLSGVMANVSIDTKQAIVYTKDTPNENVIFSTVIKVGYTVLEMSKPERLSNQI